MDDMAESEMSFGSCEGHDWSSVGSAGAPGAPGSTTRRQLAGLRDKHAQCLQVLRRKSRTSAELQDPEPARQQSGSAEVNSGLQRMLTMSSEGGEEADALEANAVQIQEEATAYYLKLRDFMEGQNKELQGLKDNSLAPQIAALGEVVKSREAALQSLHKADYHVSLLGVRGSIEAFDKMGSQRLQELHVSLDKARDLVRNQNREIEGLRAQGLEGELKSLEEVVDAQGKAIASDVGPALSGVFQGVIQARELVSGQAEELAAIATEVHVQQQEYAEELRQLKLTLFAQAQSVDIMQGEIEGLKRKEAAHESSASAWEEERLRLNKEVAQLRHGSEQQQQTGQQAEPIKIRQASEPAVPSERMNLQDIATRMPMDGVMLGVAAVAGGLFPVLVSGVLRVVWSPAMSVTPSVWAPRLTSRSLVAPARDAAPKAGGRRGALAAAALAIYSRPNRAARRPRST